MKAILLGGRRWKTRRSCHTFRYLRGDRYKIQGNYALLLWQGKCGTIIVDVWSRRGRTGRGAKHVVLYRLIHVVEGQN